MTRLVIAVGSPQLLLIEGIVEGGYLFLTGLRTLEGCQQVAEEDGIRQAVRHDMVEVPEEPGASSAGIDFQAVQIVSKEIEGAYALLEEVAAGLAVEWSDRHLHRGIVAAQLYHAALVFGQAGLDVAVCLDDLPEGVGQQPGVGGFQADGHRHVVLRGVAVQLPVDIDAALGGGQRIVFLPAPERGEVGAVLGTVCQLCHVAYGGVPQQFANGYLESCTLSDDHAQAHGTER